MNFSEKDFIGIFENVFPDGFCKHLIEEFNANQKLGITTNRLQSENTEGHYKSDNQLFCNGRNLELNVFENKNTYDMFFEGLQKCYDLYVTKFSVLKDTKVICRNFKIQKTKNGEGYHVWHHEQGNNHQNNRSLVFMLYLNSLSDDACGETEFLYQQRRIKPAANTMLIWPAAYTHAHRGNAVYGENTKYIATGWFLNE
jgi:hypothetical protein